MRSPLFAWATLVVMAAMSVGVASAEIMIVDDDGDGQPDAPTSFTVPTLETTEVDRINDFKRYCDKGAWEKAFRQLDEIQTSKHDGMIRDEEGFYVPVEQYLRGLLTSLNAEGRRAYEVFYGAKAEALWDSVSGDKVVDSETERKTLQQLYDSFFITPFGMRAADRLGDLAFERGEFSAAAGYWQSVREHHTALDTSPLRLDTKRAIALARGGRWSAFDDLVQRMRSRYGSEKVKLGGRDVAAIDYLATIGKSRSAENAHEDGDAPDGPARLGLPKSDEPLWQFTFMDDDSQQQYQQMVQRMWGRQVGGNMQGPASAFDGKRVYLNWFGVGMALDARTGKLLWRTDKADDVLKKMRNMYYYIDPDRYGASVVGDSVYMIAVNPKRVSNNEPYRLYSYAAETGKLNWSSEATMKQWSFASDPLVVDDEILIVAHEQSKVDQHLLRVEAATGKFKSEVLLGTPAVAGQNYYRKNIPRSTLMLYRGRVIVLTNSGAVLVVDRESGDLTWAFAYGMNRQQTNNYAYREADILGRGVLDNGVLYFKETDAKEMFALDIDARQLLWRRRISPEYTVAGMDGKYIYTIGSDVGAINREDKALVWAPPLVVGQGWRGPLQTDKYLYVFTPRGVFEVDKTHNGMIEQKFRGADRESDGGKLMLSGDRLIAVSNASVTAYRVRKNPD